MAAPGWYPDARDPRVLRWFNGLEWTQHVWPVGGPAPALAFADGPSTAERWLIPVGRSWQSVAASYVGLVAMLAWMVGLMGPVGALFGIAVGTGSLALGVLAVRRVAEGGHGWARAGFAIAAGALCIVLTVVLALTSV